MKIFNQEELINHLSLAKEDEIIFLLGAGCSISSGCMAAGKLTFEFKKRIYCAKNGIRLNDNSLINDNKFCQTVDNEFPSNMKNPYAHYFEMCFPEAIDRSRFIKEKFQNISPSYGYLCFANYLIKNKIRRVLTTNFDNLIEKAIRKIDEHYDITSESDNITPKLASKLNIVKLHGDYNYDCLKNTNEELKKLSDKVHNSILNCKEIIVIGYSGIDDSVMNFLFNMSKKGIKIIWCLLKQNKNRSESIETLFKENGDSGYCFIDGFDELFSKLYSFQGYDNSFINEFFKKNKNEKFDLKINNQPEQIQFNANELISDPSCYKLNRDQLFEYARLKEFNSRLSNSFLMQYKEYLYIVGDINEVRKHTSINCEHAKLVSICDETIPTDKKCKIIKELLKIYLKIRKRKVYRDNVYLETNNKIIEGLKISVDAFNGKICLLTNVNYFSPSSKEDLNIKFEINSKKSNLYARENFEKREELISKIFGGTLKFDIFDTTIEFENKCLDNVETYSKIYNCSHEPEMSVENNYSVNQIKLLNSFGPREALFSSDVIKIGVFCPSEDKQKLKKYLDLIVNGTSTSQRVGSIIPEYIGFYQTFKKKIQIEYDGLPVFSVNKHLNLPKINFKSFYEFCLRGIKKLYKEKNVDIVLIYISNKLIKFKKEDILDLHDIVKLKCANKFKTQFLEEESIDSSDDINKKIFNLSIGIYTKTIGMPWHPKEYSKDTLFLGMGFGVDSRGVTIGCSQMFDGAGRGMQLIISQITDKHRKNQYLSSDEAYDLGMKIRKTYYKTSKIDELKRIVIHRVSPFKKEEIEGFKKAFEGIEDFDLIQLIDNYQFNCYCINDGKCRNYPVKRGTTIKNSEDTAYIWTDGTIVLSDILGERSYRNSKHGMGTPLKIKKDYGNISLNEIVDDIMYLTKMDFNSSDVIYSKYPVTIKYAQKVCELLKQGKFDDDLISFEYVM